MSRDIAFIRCTTSTYEQCDIDQHRLSANEHAALLFLACCLQTYFNGIRGVQSSLPQDSWHPPHSTQGGARGACDAVHKLVTRPRGASEETPRHQERDTVPLLLCVPTNVVLDRRFLPLIMQQRKHEYTSLRISKTKAEANVGIHN